MDFNFLLMAVEETAELTDKQIMGSTVIALLIFFSYPIWLIIKWFRQHPIVNMRKLSDRLDRAAMLKERMKLADELLTDVDLTRMEERNIRAKGFTLTWHDTLNEQEHVMHFLVDGKSETTRQLKQLAKVIRKESHKELLTEVFKMPKRHGKNEDTNYIHIHNADLLDK